MTWPTRSNRSSHRWRLGIRRQPPSRRAGWPIWPHRRNNLSNLTGAPGSQQQQAQSQYTQAEIAVLQRHPSVMNDPRKMAELVGAADALIKQGYDRNSQQYASALETFLGGRNTAHSADAKLTPDDVLKISSEKFKLTPDEYNANVHKLAQLKSQGRYR